MPIKVKVLNTLIQVSDKKIDNAAIEKAKIEQTIADLNNRLNSLRKEFASEKQIATTMDNLTINFTNFYNAFKARESNIQNEIVKSEKLLQEKIDELQGYYFEKKRYEKLLNKIVEEKLALENKLEQDSLDEIAIF
jgi:flagellar export protein FliJ